MIKAQDKFFSNCLEQATSSEAYPPNAPFGLAQSSLSSTFVLPIVTHLHCFIYREEPIDYGALEESIRKTAKKMNLEDVDGMCCFCKHLII